MLDGATSPTGRVPFYLCVSVHACAVTRTVHSKHTCTRIAVYSQNTEVLRKYASTEAWWYTVSGDKE